LHYFHAIARIIHEKIRCLYTGYVCQRQTDGFDVALGERLRRHARYNVSLNSNHFARSKYDINVLECAGMFEQKQITNYLKQHFTDTDTLFIPEKHFNILIIASHQLIQRAQVVE